MKPMIDLFVFGKKNQLSREASILVNPAVHQAINIGQFIVAINIGQFIVANYL